MTDDDHQAVVVAVANHKGGVGKTTTTVNLAAGLGAAGYRTLVVDADAQANSTWFFMQGADDEVENDLRSVIRGEATVAEAVIPTHVENVDVLPASLDLAVLDTDLVSLTRGEDRVKRALAPLLADYDVVLLDLPPNLGQTVVAALGAADHILVPTEATVWGVRGVGMLMGWTEELREQEATSASVLGVLLCKVQQQTTIFGQARDEFDSQLPGLRFTTTIPRRAAVERMVGQFQPYTEHDADLTIKVTFEAFVAEVIERLHNPSNGGRALPVREQVGANK